MNLLEGGTEDGNLINEKDGVGSKIVTSNKLGKTNVK